MNPDITAVMMSSIMVVDLRYKFLALVCFKTVILVCCAERLFQNKTFFQKIFEPPNLVPRNYLRKAMIR